MVDDPRDSAAYRWAIVFLGLAAVAAIVGAVWVAAEHKCVRNIPDQVWFLAAAAIGVFVGALIPFALRVDWSTDRGTGDPAHSWDPLAILGGLALVILCGVALIFGLTHKSLTLDAVAVTFGSILIGLPVPSPGRVDR